MSLEVYKSIAKTLTIPTASVLALAATPYTLVPAPGPRLMLVFESAEFILDYNSIAYTEDGDNMAIKYTDASGVAVSTDIESTGFIDQEADTRTNAIPVKDQIVALTGATNQPLVLCNTNVAYAAGNSPLVVTIVYQIHSVPS